MPKDLEAMLAKTLQDVRDNRHNQAMLDVEAMLKAYPNFRLAHLIRGDLLLAKAQPLSGIGNAPNAAHQIADLRDEIRVRLQHLQEKTPTNRVPRYLLQLHSGQRYAIVVDTGKARLYLFENDNGEARLVADYYVSSGKAGAEKNKEGDQKTPLGVYFVTASLPRGQLSDFYGSGAFPISYPNEWDKRQGKNGHGIWLHGVPSDTYSRPPRASNGCVVLTNPDMVTVGKNLQIGLTPVIISDHVEWADPKELAAPRQELTQTLEAWRKDWESLDTDKYLRHYSKSFNAGGQELHAFSEQKRMVNASKSWLKIQVANVSVFAYPGNNNLAVVTFDQDYNSNNLKNQMRKRQYWQKEGSDWHIVYEGGA
ncbi:MAG: L,D-transpeptidase family protein [Sulfuricella sp.]|nr:L,D-transpeptidase family protein [Sulfuricella sp.]